MLGLGLGKNRLQQREDLFLCPTPDVLYICHMAGQPMKRQMIADIEKSGGMEKLIERIADGETMSAIARGYNVSRRMLSHTLNKNPQTKALLDYAKRERSHAYAEQALDIVDQVEASPNEITKAREQANIRRWLAGCENPESYGQKQKAVTSNEGDLHLDA